jgi:zinc transporter, ZIP family
VKAVAVGAGLALAAAGVWLALATPWRDRSSAAGEMEVTRAAFAPGRISLVVFNGSGDATRVAQIILNDAFVDFRASTAALAPGDAETITVAYPWIEGEAYDIELLTSTGRTVGYEVEEAEAA